MKYKLVIFDFDGTLADSLPWFISIVNQLAEHHKFKRIETREHTLLRGYDARRVIEHLGIPMWRIPLIARDLRQRMAQDLQSIALFNGVDRLLRDLSGRGVALAITSSNSPENIRRVLGADNAALIQRYECGASLFGKGKKFRKLLREFAVSPAEAICIGDEIRDLQAARTERIPFGAVSWGYTTPHSFAACSPDELFISIDDIAEKLIY